MATLQQRNGAHRLLFQYDGKQHSFNIGSVSQTDHRHHRPPQGGLFAVACERDGLVDGVAVVGRPVARMLADGFTAEVTRLATDGSKNACSMLYAAAWRACRALG